jgi:hypothetical protein
MEIITAIKWIETCWLRARPLCMDPIPQHEGIDTNPILVIDTATTGDEERGIGLQTAPSKLALSLFECSPRSVSSPVVAEALSPRRRLARERERERSSQKVARYVSSPMPFLVFLMLLTMIILIFVDVMPISGLICLVSILMVLVVVLGNHWRNQVLWDMENEYDYYYQSGISHAKSTRHRGGSGRCDGLKYDSDNCSTTVEPPRSAELPVKFSPDGITQLQLPPQQEIDGDGEKQQPQQSDRHSEVASLGPMTKEDRLDNLNEFFDAIFSSIDYSLLLIFLGTFVVVANMSSTGIPRKLWFVLTFFIGRDSSLIFNCLQELDCG